MAACGGGSGSSSSGGSGGGSGTILAVAIIVDFIARCTVAIDVVVIVAHRHCRHIPSRHCPRAVTIIVEVARRHSLRRCHHRQLRRP